jgi:hypothetical protein
VSRRTFVYIGIGIALLVAGRLFSTGATSATGGPETADNTTDLQAPEPPPSFSMKPAPPPAPLKRPPSSMMEVGVLCDKTPEALAALMDREALAAAIPPKLCGDEAACEAVRATLRDEHSTTLTVVSSSDWSLEKINVDTAARNLTTREQAGLKARPRIAVVHVNTATSAKQLTLRTAIAAAAVLADKTGGLVWDQLLNRVENAHDFAAHAVTSAIGAPTFRRDRIELLYEPKEEGTVRILTGGLSRWGVADVEMLAVPTPASAGIGDLVLGVAAALANGTSSSPVTVSRDDLGSARGLAYPSDAGLPPAVPIDLDVTSEHPENGDPNDFMARIDPPEGEGPLAIMTLAERFFGPILAASPGAGILGERKGRAQSGLASAIARWTAGRNGGAQLLVLLPFGIPGDAGTESMWIDVTRADGKSVTGKVLDDPLGATDVHKGDEVTRPRGDVEDMDLKLPKG